MNDEGAKLQTFQVDIGRRRKKPSVKNARV